MAQKCEICDRQSDFFEGVDYGDRCIFHCDKSDEAKWGNPESEDVGIFWRAIREQIATEIAQNAGEHNFENYYFPVFDNFGDNLSGRFVFTKNVSFGCAKFLKRAVFQGIDFTKDVTFGGAFFYCGASFESVNFDHLILTPVTNMDTKNFSFSFANITISKAFDFHIASISGLKIRSLKLIDKAFLVIEILECDEFYLSNLYGEDTSINIKNLGIKGVVKITDTMFGKTEFNNFNLNSCKKIILTNVSFIGSHLTNIKWGEINEERFQIDRQMARQLKSINDAQGETVIANDFYALEMRLRSKELNWREHFGEKLVQNIHGLVSNHSNDWVLPSIWFFVIGLLFVVLAKGVIPVLLVAFVFGLIGTSVFLADKIPTKYYKGLAFGFFAVSALLYSESFVGAEYLAAFVNPLNIKDSKDLLGDTNLVLIYACRIIEVFIGYQIITAIRKNTRRK